MKEYYATQEDENNKLINSKHVGNTVDSTIETIIVTIETIMDVKNNSKNIIHITHIIHR